jgi:hypothetical protein
VTLTPSLCPPGQQDRHAWPATALAQCGSMDGGFCSHGMHAPCPVAELSAGMPVPRQPWLRVGIYRW